MSNLKIAPLVVMACLVFLIFLVVTGNAPFNRVGTMNQMVYGIYSDGSYKLLGSSEDGIFDKKMTIYDASGNQLDGFCILAFADFQKTVGDYDVDFILYNYYVDKITSPYNKRVYERPWVTNTQFVKDSGFTSNPPDSIGSNGVVTRNSYYFWKMTPSSNAKTVALGDPLTPTRPYPISHNGVTAYPIVFWIDTRMAEQSYGCQLGLPADNSLQTYQVTLNMLLENEKGTINPNDSSFTTTLKLRRNNWDNTVDFQIYWPTPYIYN